MKAFTCRPIILALSALILSACAVETPTVPDQLVLSPPAAATVTPGGRIVVVLPTPAPPTPTAVVGPNEPSGADALSFPVPPPELGGPEECPSPGNPPPPDAPPSYAQYIDTINRFLSAGGAVPFLASILRTWGAITDQAGTVSDAYDLTGDGVYEVLVVVIDPLNTTVSPQPGQLMIFGCHQAVYRLLYSSDYGPGFGAPRLLHVGDMNADAMPELVFLQERCQGVSCVQAAQVLTWSAPNDGFLALNVDTIGAPGGRFSIQDLDGDGVLEIMIQGSGTASGMAAGPPRGTTTVWDWNGLNYVRALSQLDPPVYRIHVIHDADRALEQGDGEEAVRLYREALENPLLGTWSVIDEAANLRAYALYRLVLTYAYLENGAALDTYTRLLAENPEGSPAAAFAALGDAFWRAFQASHNLHTGCVAALEAAALRPESLRFLNSYGPANRAYQATDLCPF